MATDANLPPRPFDVKTVEYLIGLMGTHDLTEVSLREGDQKIRLRKGGLAPMLVPGPMAPPASASAAAPTLAPAAPTKKLLDIKSIMVGTVYLKPRPDKPEFVTVGTPIRPDTTVCTIEAMKIFNEIKAEVTGTVAEVCVANGDGVDYGTVLFRVDPGV